MGYITSPVILHALIFPTDAKAKGPILCIIIHKEIQIFWDNSVAAGEYLTTFQRIAVLSSSGQAIKSSEGKVLRSFTIKGCLVSSLLQ
jgi:hypothetical protein